MYAGNITFLDFTEPISDKIMIFILECKFSKRLVITLIGTHQSYVYQPAMCVVITLILVHTSHNVCQPAMCVAITQILVHTSHNIACSVITLILVHTTHNVYSACYAYATPRLERLD